jgi:hypothetical protein
MLPSFLSTGYRNLLSVFYQFSGITAYHGNDAEFSATIAA